MVARFGGDAAHAEWFYGFRLAQHTDLDSRLVRACVPGWSSPQPSMREPVRPNCWNDCGPLVGCSTVASLAARATRIVIAHTRPELHCLSAASFRPVAALWNRIETTNNEMTETPRLARHRATTFWGLLTRIANSIFANPLRRLGIP